MIFTKKDTSLLTNLFHFKADDPSTYMEVVDVAAKNDNWEELVKYLQVRVGYMLYQSSFM